MPVYYPMFVIGTWWEYLYFIFSLPLCVSAAARPANQIQPAGPEDNILPMPTSLHRHSKGMLHPTDKVSS